MRNTLGGLLAVAALGLCGAAAKPAAGSLPPSSSLLISGPLEVVVRNVKSAKGVIHVDVCPQETFLTDDDCAYSATAPATVGVTTVVIPHLPPGRYAVQAYHDENENGTVDRNRLGIPKESVGFSRDPNLLLGPPRFKSVAFDHAAAGGSIRLKLHSFP
jgi:uncharacterized protein (DUF2141 family)